MPILIQCPNPACGAAKSVADAVAGRGVKCKRCGTPFKATPSLDGVPKGTNKSSSSSGDPFPTLPAEFGRYRVLKLLGRGGMGAVYLAHDSQLGRQVALKLPSFDASETKRVERFVREAKSAAGLMHPNICPVYDAGQIGGRPFITMAYIDGPSLEAHIDPDAPMDPREAAGIARKVASALQEAHDKGIVHRDLKPANVMMTAKGEPVVMDFGLAKRVAGADADESKLTHDGAVMGTPSYMAPEQVRGEHERIGPATDVYALGVMLFEMLTGQTPYTGPAVVVMTQIVAAPVPTVAEFRPGVDSRLDAVCRKAMAKQPADRFASMTAFAIALDRAGEVPSAPPQLSSVVGELPAATATLTSKSVTEVRTRGATAERPPLKKRPIIVGAGGAICLLVGFVGYWAGGAHDAKPKDDAPVPATRPAEATVAELPVKAPEPAAPDFAPEKSEWAGAGLVKNHQGERLTGGAWTFTERRGRAFKAVWRSGSGWKAAFEGVVDANGRITLEARERLEPDAKSREEIRGTGEVGTRHMTLLVEELDNSATARLEFKRLPDGGEGFNFPGRWQCFHRPMVWSGFRTITEDAVFTDRNPGQGPWARDGGLIITHYPNGGREWLIIDPDNPNELHGSNGLQIVTWVRK